MMAAAAGFWRAIPAGLKRALALVLVVTIAGGGGYALGRWDGSALAEAQATIDRQARTITALETARDQARTAAEVAKAAREMEAARAADLRAAIEDIRNAGGADAPLSEDLRRVLRAHGLQ
ncbi:hypothetical protein [Citreimonas sp.]|uniref:hypothetical protein n=1 Tax=Citreimonas sp. TaxID=3036715 RepID=UPI004059D689